MRVTTNALTSHYLKNSNSALENMMNINDRILTQRKYNRASEDSVSAAKAAHIRKSLSNLDIYDENISNAKSLFSAAEDMLYDIANDTYLTIESKVVSAQDTMSQQELDIVAQEIEKLADHMVQDMNQDFAERQMFGSMSNDKTPFTTFTSVKVFDADGNEIASFGNEQDTAEAAGGGELTYLRMNDNAFYDENGAEVDLASAEAGTKLYDSNGVYYSAVVGENSSVVSELTGNAFDKVYEKSHKFYDEDGNEITDAAPDFDGEYYYDSPDIENAVKFTVNGEADVLKGQTDRIVCYNDVPINLEGSDLINAVTGGRIEYYNSDGTLADSKEISIDVEEGAKGDYSNFPGCSPIYVDVGLGINYNKLSATSLDVALNGAQMTGCGIDDDGDSQNLMQLVYDTAKALRAGDMESVNRYIDKLETSRNDVLSSITTLDIEQNNLDFYTSKNSVYRLSLYEKQNDVEGCDLTEEITNWRTAQAAYNATLSMGSNSLPKSLFDFI